MGSNGAREKALQFLREVPRLSKANLKVPSDFLKVQGRADIVFCRRVCLKWLELLTNPRSTEDEARTVLITVSPACSNSDSQDKTNLHLRMGKQRPAETLLRTAGLRVRQQSHPETNKLREILQLRPEVSETVPHHHSGADTADGGHQQTGHLQAGGHGRSLWH